MKRMITLLLVTFCALMLELALIRWVAGQVRIAAYFPNLILIAAFFGMGIGCLRQGRRSSFWLMPVALLILVGISYAGSKIAFSGKGGSEYFWLLYYNLPENAPVVNNLILPLWVIFVLTVLVFIPIGQQVADILKECQDENKTLLGYSFDLGGSLLGVIVFTLLSFWSTFPIAWFAIALIPGVFVLGKQSRQLGIFLLCSAGVVVIVDQSELADVYSPYYSLDYQEVFDPDTGQPLRINVTTNGSLHQVMLPLGDQMTETNGYAKFVEAGFNEPFAYLESKPANALVLGAGTGNDVAILLKQGVTEIDAVEIDPAILDYGRRMHPSKPYDSPYVTPHVDDARSFLNKSEKLYDLIIFGTLDSMTRLSALSNVRLDNFVYTMESLKSARRLLKPNGGVVLHFMVGEPHIESKILALIAETFEEYPIIHTQHRGLFNRSFMAGPAFAHVQQEERSTKYQMYRNIMTEAGMQLPTDDWPYLYLQNRQIGSFYLKMIGIILVTAIGLMLLLGRDLKENRPFWKSVDLPMFLFGAAFLILNTKSVTEIGLIWGNTWMTNAITFASILFVLLVSTLLFAYKPLPLNLCFAGLFASLLILYLFPLTTMLSLPVYLKLLGTILFIGTPFFFAGASFAGVFKTSHHVPSALGWNVIGALCGGLLEYLNMLLGFKALYVVALVFYLIAFMVFSRRKLPAT